MAEVVEAAIDQVAEAFEEMGDAADVAAEVTRRLTSRDLKVLAGGLALGAVAGAGVGYLTLKNRMRLKYEAIADKDIREMREHFMEMHPVNTEKPQLEELVEDLGYTGTVPTSPEESFIPGDQPWNIPPERSTLLEAVEDAKKEEPKVVEQNVFDSGDPNWDYANEMRLRTDNAPYIIHLDEYRNNETDYEQTTYTYYTGDEVLADQLDTVVDAVDNLVGLDNLLKFGHGSKDPNTVYVRNTELSMEFEIVKSDGKYAHEVHGFVEHSEPRHNKGRQRFDDE